MQTLSRPKFYLRLGVIPTFIRIGEVTTLNVKNWEFNPDDRQTKHETIGGVVVQDLGCVEKGETISCEVDICLADKDTFFGYWINRTLVPIIDEAGNLQENCRVKIIRYKYIPHFSNYYHCVLEIWRV